MCKISNFLSGFFKFVKLLEKASKSLKLFNIPIFFQNLLKSHLWRFWASDFSRRVLSSQIPEAELSVARSSDCCRFKSILAAVVATSIIAVGDDAVADARQLVVAAINIVGHALD